MHGAIEGVKRTVTNTDNGVVIQMTSDDPAIVETIQSRMADSPPCQGKGCGCAGPGTCTQGMCAQMEGVKRTVTNTDNGVVIEITSNDPAVVGTIQSRAADSPGCHGKGHGRAGQGMCTRMEGVKRTVTNTENGVVIEMTSNDPAIVETIRSRMADSPQCHGKGHGCAGGETCGHGTCAQGTCGKMEGVKRTVTNTDSGIIIELTSDDPAVVETLQSQMASKPAGCPGHRGGL
jgi:TusA-related sulfurtransferase